MLIEDSKDSQRKICLPSPSPRPPHGGPWGYLYLCSTQPASWLWDVSSFWLGLAWRGVAWSARCYYNMRSGSRDTKGGERGEGEGRGRRILESNDVVSGLDIGDALTHRLDYAGTLVSEDDGECTLGVLAGECVGIYQEPEAVSNTPIVLTGWQYSQLTD